MIDIATPDDAYVNTKETGKPSKYKDLDIAVSRMWKARTTILPVMNEASGTIKKGLDRNRQLLPGHPSDIKLQEIKLMSTAHSMPTVLG